MAFADVVPSWGNDGVGVNARAFYEQADGKILGSDAFEQTRHLIRLNADGSYDTAFSSDGRVPFSQSITTVRQITGGKIVVAYSYFRHIESEEDNDVYGYGVARFTANGAPDATFGNNGNNVVTFREGKIGRYPDLGDAVIDADGSTYFGVSGNSLNILGGGMTELFSSFVVKFNAQGQRDATFGKNGVATLPGITRPGRRGDFARTISSLDLGDNGPLLISGTEFRYDSKRVGNDDYYDNKRTGVSAFVMRLKADGTEDAGFGTAGTFKVDKTIIINGRDDGESADVLRQDNGHVLLVTRVNGRLRVFTLTAKGRTIAALSRQQDDSVDGDGEIQFAEELANGNLVVVRRGVLFELRQTDAGFVAQAPRLPAGDDGKALPFGSDFGNTLLPLRDGSVLLRRYGSTIKFSGGDGRTPREDDLPFARQSSITTPDASQTDIPQLDAFFHDERGGLKYRQRTLAGRWGKVETVDATRGAGLYLSATGTSVVYTDGNTGDLKFAQRRKNGVWKIETIDSAGATGFYCSLVRTAADTLAVAYYDRTRGDLRLARRAADGKWTAETVDAAGNVGRHAKLVVRPDGGLSIAYATATTSGLRLAEQKAGVTRGGWTFTDLATSGVDVSGLDVDYFLTNNDPEPSGPSELTTTVAIYDDVADDLIVAYRPNAGSRFRLVREKSRGVVGLNPHVLHEEPGAVSFYDQTRNQVRTTRIVERKNRFSLATEAVPTIASGGMLASPVVSNEDASIYNGYAGGGYTSTYAWVDDDGVFKVRGPV